MANDERLKKKIKIVYTEIMRKCINSSFSFPNGGRFNILLEQFITKFLKICNGEFNALRLVDYCVYQIHRCKEHTGQRIILSMFKDAALAKFNQKSSKNTTYYENQWLKEHGLTRGALSALITDSVHPLAKYIYMPSEECTKKRNLGTSLGFLRCSISTMMWSPFSEACTLCSMQEQCKAETDKKFPELYRIRMEEYGKRR